MKVASTMVRVRGKENMGKEGEGGRDVGGGDKGVDRRSAVTDKLTKLVRKYTSFEEDQTWANRGLIGIVIDGTSIPLI